MRSVMFGAMLFGCVWSTSASGQTIERPVARIPPAATNALRVPPPVQDTSALWREAGAAQRAYIAALKRAVDAETTRQSARGAIDADLLALKSEIDSLSGMSEMDALKLQAAMDRMSKMMSTLSNLLRKQSDTAQTITQNLK